VFAVAAMVAGCVGADDHEASAPSQGSGATTGSGATAGATDRARIHIPLVQPAVGAIYQLNTFVKITESDGTVVTLDGSGNEAALDLDVPAGITVIELVDGWQLLRSTDGGATFAPVDALLATMNPVNLITAPNKLSVWTFEFIVRNPDGTLRLQIGVIDAPRQLDFEVFVQQASAELAVYNNTQIELSAYFATSPFQVTEADGTRDLVYGTDTDAIEAVGDTQGLLAPILKRFAGGFLQLTERIHPDGSQDTSLSYQAFVSGPFTELDLAPGPAFLAADGDGFPVDGVASGFANPFSLIASGDPANPDLAGTVGSLTVFPAEPSTN
jgi:hypothetical protein